MSIVLNCISDQSDPPSTQPLEPSTDAPPHRVLRKRSRQQFYPAEVDRYPQSNEQVCHRNELLMQMKMMVRPWDPRADGRYSSKYPMSVEKWLLLFPDSSSLEPKRPPIKMNAPRRGLYKQKRKLFDLKLHQPEQLEHILGRRWFVTHERDSVGIFVCAKLSLWTHALTEYQIDRNADIIPGSIEILENTFIHICVHFRKILRHPSWDPTGENWYNRALDVITEYNSQK